MYCYKCGTDVPDDSAHCFNCGAVLVGEPTVKAVPVKRPQSAPNNVQPKPDNDPFNSAVNNNFDNFGMPDKASGGPLLGKKEFFKTKASAKTKTARRIVPVLAIALIVSMFAGYFVVFNTSIEKIPIISVFLNIAGVSTQELDEFRDDFSEDVEDIEAILDDSMDELEDEFSDEQLKLIDEWFELEKKLIKSVSISNIKKMIEFSEKAEEIDLDEELGMDGLFDFYDDDWEEIISFVKTVFFAAIAVAYLFSLLGGFFRKKGLLIVGLLFTLVFNLLFCNIIVASVVLAIHIAMIVLLSIAISEFKTYKSSYGM